MLPCTRSISVGAPVWLQTRMQQLAASWQNWTLSGEVEYCVFVLPMQAGLELVCHCDEARRKLMILPQVQACLHTIEVAD